LFCLAFSHSFGIKCPPLLPRLSRDWFNYSKRSGDGVVTAGTFVETRPLGPSWRSRLSCSLPGQASALEIVVLSRVLSGPVNQYYSDLSQLVVDRVNGLKITALADLERAFARPAGGYHLVEFAGGGPPVVLDAGAAEEEHEKILERYRVPVDRYLSRPGEKS